MNLSQWFVVFFVGAIHFFAFSHRMDVVPFFVEMKEMYQVGYAEIGGLVSAFLLGYALFQIPAGVLADRYSPKKVVLAGLAAMMVSSLLLVMTKSFLVALAMRFIMGASSALLFSPGIKLISEFVPKERRGLSVGMMEGAAGMGMLLTLTIFPLLSVYWPWRYLFLALSLFMLPLLLLFWKLPSKAEMENRERDKPPIPDGRGGEGNAAARWFEPVRNARVLRLLGIAFFGLFGLYAYLAWLPTYLTAVMGYSKQEAGWIMALAMISQVIMAPVSGKVSDWMGQRKLTLVIGTGVLALCTVWLFGLQDLGIHVNALLIGMGISWSMAPMLTLATEVVHARMTGFVISLMNTLGQIASAISGYYYGLLFDRSGDFRMIWLSCLAALMIRILLCLGNWEKGEGMQVAENGKHLPA